MKQKTPSSPTTARSVLKKQGHKSLQSPPPPPPPPRLRASSKAPKSPPEVVNRESISSTRAESVPPDLKNVSRAKRGVVVNKPKLNEEVLGSQKAEEGKIVIVARPRRRVGDFGSRKSEDDDSHGKKKKELLQEKLEVSENLIKSLQSEVLALREELDRVKSLNVELESQNTKLTQNLAAAEAKISTVDIGNNGKVRILMCLSCFASDNMKCV